MTANFPRMTLMMMKIMTMMSTMKMMMNLMTITMTRKKMIWTMIMMKMKRIRYICC